MSHPPIVCLTPIKNEAWILERFLRAASLWADYIIIADQQSDDESRSIAARFPKVRLIDNPSTAYNEVARQQLLIRAARAIAIPSLLIALDADEFLSANVFTSIAWQQAISAKPGTRIVFSWANIWPDLKHYWLTPERYFGFMDDGCEHTGDEIHNHRVPVPGQGPQIVLDDVRVLHYQYADWARMQSKHRWYQCWERIRFPRKRAIDIYRLYHHMNSIPRHKLVDLPQEWVEGYNVLGVDLSAFPSQPHYWWDREVLSMFDRHGAETFRKEAIWDYDWNKVARRLYGEKAPVINDPRSQLDKLMHSFLQTTQPVAHTVPMLAFQKLFALIGW